MLAFASTGHQNQLGDKKIQSLQWGFVRNRASEQKEGWRLERGDEWNEEQKMLCRTVVRFLHKEI